MRSYLADALDRFGWHLANLADRCFAAADRLKPLKQGPFRVVPRLEPLERGTSRVRIPAWL